MPTPLVSFIVTCYNFEKYIKQAIESILNQKGSFDLEMIVIDDCSSDKSVNIISSVKDERVYFIKHEINKGSNFSVNEGFRLARGKYIARLDGDDAYYPDFLVKTIPIFEAHPEVGLIYGDYTSLDENSEITNYWAKVDRGNLPIIGNEFKQVLHKNYITAPTIIARKEAWNLGLPVPAEFSFLDWYLSLSILLEWKSFYINSPLAFYRIHSQGMHRQMIRNTKGEFITRKVLTHFTRLGLEKHKLTNEEISNIFYQNFIILGDKYFGYGMDEDAQRCYTDAWLVNPCMIFDIRHFFYLIISLLGTEPYNRVKAFLKK